MATDVSANVGDEAPSPLSWLARLAGAIAAVPDELVHATTLIGDEAHVRERIRKYRKAGIDEWMLHPIGADTSAQLDALGRAVELVREEGGS